MKKILLLSSLTLLLTPATSQTMDQPAGLQREISDAAIQHGDPNAPRYALFNAEALQNNPVFKRLQTNNPYLQQEIETIVEDLQLLPLETTIAVLEDMQKKDLEKSQLVSSMVLNPEATESQSSSSSGLSWMLRYQRLCYGDKGALQYALDNNQFDPNNTDHVELYNNAKEALVTHHNDANNSANTTYTTIFNVSKANQCYAMVAALKSLETRLEESYKQIEQIAIAQEKEKETFLQEHHAKYEQNNNGLQQLITASTTIKDSAPLSIILETTSELKDSLMFLNDLSEKVAYAADRIKSHHKNVGKLSAMFAIENNNK